MITYCLSNYELDALKDRKTIELLTEEIASLLQFEDEGIAVDFESLDFYDPKEKYSAIESVTNVFVHPESISCFIECLIDKAESKDIEEKLFLYNMSPRIERTVNKLFQRRRLSL